jgi:large subunit ribosomal protein L17
MRHRVKGRKLGRTASHRKATLKALCTALIKEHRIETTLAKAKELRTFIEPLITTAKVDTTHNRRKAFSFLQDKYAVTELFETVGPAAADRPGGYTRVLKLGFRLGDSAEMAVIELVDFNDVAPELKSAKKKRTRRAGKTSKPVAAEQEKDEKPKAAKPIGDDKKDEEAPSAEVTEETIDAVAETGTEESTDVEAVKQTEDTSAEAESTEAESAPDDSEEIKKTDSDKETEK